jgi:hypothetical protein
MATAVAGQDEIEFGEVLGVVGDAQRGFVVVDGKGGTGAAQAVDRRGHVAEAADDDGRRRTASRQADAKPVRARRAAADVRPPGSAGALRWRESAPAPRRCDLRRRRRRTRVGVALDARDPAAVVGGDRRGVALQVGPAQRRRIDPAAAGKPPAAVGDRPAASWLACVAVDEAQVVGGRLLGFDDRCCVLACRSSRARCSTPV